MRVLGKYDYGAVSTIVIVILAVMLAMEAAVNRLRKAIKE
jgi:hypothetical protein